MTKHDIAEQAYKKGYEDGSPKWISVTDELPKCFGYFLVTLKEIESGAVYSNVAKFDPFAKSWKPAFVMYEKYIVTHWGHMPQPKKGE